MAKWLRDYLSFGGRRPPPQPPTPDYTESDILRAYRVQKNLDFEDPYEDSESRPEPDPADPGDTKGHGDSKFDSPKHRLIKVEAADMARAKALLDNPREELEVDTEYSDPFDAQPHPPPPDDGYMEPYDAQRVISVQFDSPEWERTPGSIKELRRPPPRSPQPAERVDPALPLEKQPWFHGPLSRVDAENLLSLCKEGSYLVRLSETSAQDCSLSLRSSQGFLHLKFTWTRENQVVLGQHSGPFASVPELVLHYSARPLPVQGAEHLALLYPVTTQRP
ncbi:SH2 domain-containing adapter protein D isoform X3 [Marmota marmota marmota]|uniref:SH2 domain-containing adapter protein D isoform X3 n=1 Tax=Marmota marmota marmota TaxID=9994 RepID=UPI00209294AA|nr:SH2 domain-containing adapter protein D isoform X3 [Marmota marmota marmota]